MCVCPCPHPHKRTHVSRAAVLVTVQRVLFTAIIVSPDAARPLGRGKSCVSSRESTWNWQAAAPSEKAPEHENFQLRSLGSAFAVGCSTANAAILDTLGFVKKPAGAILTVDQDLQGLRRCADSDIVLAPGKPLLVAEKAF